MLIFFLRNAVVCSVVNKKRDLGNFIDLSYYRVKIGDIFEISENNFEHINYIFLLCGKFRSYNKAYMQKNLVIVESPAKAKTIGGFLGAGFAVTSSMGHIRDLKKKGLGVDVDHDFKPDYEISLIRSSWYQN